MSWLLFLVRVVNVATGGTIVDVVGQGRWDSRAGLRCFFFSFFFPFLMRYRQFSRLWKNCPRKPTDEAHEEVGGGIGDGG